MSLAAPQSAPRVCFLPSIHLNHLYWRLGSAQDRWQDCFDLQTTDPFLLSPRHCRSQGSSSRLQDRSNCINLVQRKSFGIALMKNAGGGGDILWRW
jgi:hypothetical protein